MEGIVQGVGFRPFVYTLATGLGLGGLVGNDLDGVFAEVEGRPESVAEFVAALRRDAPPLASIERITTRPLPPDGSASFCIAPSESGDQRRALVSADIATCADCLRRARRPGRPAVPLPVHQLHELRAAIHDHPRRALRPAADLDGRASPCAPLRRGVRRPRATAGSTPSRSAAPPADRGCAGRRRGRGTAGHCLRRRSRPRQGCSRAASCWPSRAWAATTSPPTRPASAAVAALRARKHREDKPFAVMVADLAAARGAVRRRRHRGGGADRPPAADRAAARAAGTRRRPVGRPRQPPAGRHAPLYAAAPSAARRDPPADGADQRQRLGRADRVHRRRRLAAARAGSRTHSSPTTGPSTPGPTTRWCARSDGRESLISRSRGYAPEPVGLRTGFPRPVLACGAELKNTFCLAVRRHAFVSPAHRRPGERGDPPLVHRGNRALLPPVRHPARGHRARPAPGLPVDQIRRGTRRDRARRS